jgi:hypothetical protein
MGAVARAPDAASRPGAEDRAEASGRPRAEQRVRAASVHLGRAPASAPRATRHGHGAVDLAVDRRLARVIVRIRRTRRPRTICRPAGRRASTVPRTSTVSRTSVDPAARAARRRPGASGGRALRARLGRLMAINRPGPSAGRRGIAPRRSSGPAKAWVTPVAGSPRVGPERRHLPWDPTRSSSPDAVPSRRHLPRAGRRIGCWSRPSGARRSNGSCSMPRPCASPSSRSRAAP